MGTPQTRIRSHRDVKFNILLALIDEACGRGWQTAIHSEDLPELLERWRSLLAFGEPREMEACFRRFDGEYRWFPFPYLSVG
jgi:PAS domain-containing protein